MDAEKPKRPRILFVLSTILGHKVYSHRIYEAVKDLDYMDKEYLYIDGEDYKRFPAPIILRESDILTVAWIARKKFEEAFVDSSFDGFLFQTWDPMFGLWKWSKGVKNIIVTDVTPVDMMKLIEREQGRENSLSLKNKIITYLKANLWNQVLKRYFKKVDYFLAWSNWCSDSLKGDYGISPKKIEVLPCPIDTGSWRPREDESINSKPILLFVGDFQRKGGDFLVNLYNKYLASICTLRIVTTTWPAKKDVQPGIELFQTRIERDELLGLYQSSDLFVMPTVRESFGIALAEAASVGLPIITTYNVSGMREIVEDGTNGYLLPYGDEQAWAEKVKQLVEDSDLRNMMSRNARKIALEKFSIDRFNSKVRKAVEGLANGKA